ncbi:hypothetical protein [Bradyrhizobium sp. URHD0069]|nr:hypothetical protein [Bradyrhizobium sp. URHD0069]
MSAETKELLKFIWWNDETGGIGGMLFFFAIGLLPFLIWAMAQ